MKFFTILFVVLLIASVIASCFIGYAPFVGKLATALIFLTVGAGVFMVLFIVKNLRSKK